MELIDRWWEAVLAGFSKSDPLALTPWPLLGLVALCVLLTVPRASWRIFGLYVTFVHELGHAFAALATGRFVHGLKIRMDHSGELVSSGKPGFSAVFSGFWGYPAPAAVGLALVGSTYYGHASAALSIGALALLVSLIFLRNWAGIAVALCSALAAQLLVVFTPARAIAWVVLGLGLMLLVGSVRDLFKVLGVHTRRRGLVASSDAYILATRSWLPAWFWLLGFVVVIGGAVLISAWMIVLMLR
ncbi:M50 family metallopeptidase [Paeniglutamicibacter sp. MACA_103]|uniref:M50 family metallopeptidase n=1 Tax=Paeniglutamicibacter sp. MACA_103 TaxID=3377337 RepID=UPI0038933646